MLVKLFRRKTAPLLGHALPPTRSHRKQAAEHAKRSIIVAGCTPVVAIGYSSECPLQNGRLSGETKAVHPRQFETHEPPEKHAPCSLRYKATHFGNSRCKILRLRRILVLLLWATAPQRCRKPGSRFRTAARRETACKLLTVVFDI